MVAPPSRAIVITARSSPFSYTRVCGPAAMGFSPLQNSIRLKTAKSRNPVNAYGMTKSHVTALRTYLSSTDLLMSYRLRVSWNLPKHPAENTTPTDTTSTSATTFPRRLFPIFSSFSRRNRIWIIVDPTGNSFNATESSRGSEADPGPPRGIPRAIGHGERQAGAEMRPGRGHHRDGCFPAGPGKRHPRHVRKGRHPGMAPHERDDGPVPGEEPGARMDEGKKASS